MANTYTDLLKLRLPALGDTGWDDEINDNVEILEVTLGAVHKGNHVINGCAPTDGGGLQVDYAAGNVDVAGTKRVIGASNKTCTGGMKNWLYVNSAGTVVISTTRPTGDYVPLAMIDCAAADIDRIADLRFIMENLMIKTLEMSGGGTSINEISTDGTLAGDSDDAVPTEKAVKTYVDGKDYIKGDGTAGRVLRRMLVKIQDGTAANTIKVTTEGAIEGGWNGDSISTEDNLAKSGSTTSFALDVTGTKLTIKDSALTGSCVNSFGKMQINKSGTGDLTVYDLTPSSGIVLNTRTGSDGASYDLTTIGAGTPYIQLLITYITDA